MNIEQLVGRTIGQYRLDELLGVGAMGAVYRAHQPNLERDIAVKILSPALAQQTDYAARFLREAKIVGSLEHPHIIPIHDYGTTDGISYVAMRLLNGGSLAQRLNARAMRGESVPSLGETAHLLRQLASALDYAHRKGVVHRDIKPSNIMFDEEGTPYLVDFGIAKLMNSATMITQDNRTFGTPHYMPPEQWRDEELTPETDQYALAIVIYTLLTGQPPFDAPTPHALMYKHFNETPPAPHTVRASLPPQIAEVLNRALAKNPKERFLTVNAFSQAFSAAIAGHEGESTGFFTFTLPEEALKPEIIPPQPSKLPEEKPARPPAPATIPRMGQIPPAPPPPEPRPQGAAAYPPPSYTGEQPRPAVPPLLMGIGAGALLLALVVCGGLALLASQLNIFENDVPAATSAARRNTPINPTAAPQITEVVETTEVAGNVTPTALPLPGSTLPPGTRIAAENVGNLGQLLSLSHETNPVRGVDYSPNGAIIATGDGAGNVQLWDSQTGARQRLMNNGGGVVYAVDFNADGTRLVSGHEDGSIRLWDVSSGQQITILGRHSGTVRDVAFSPDGSLVASGSEDYTARVWDVANQSERAALQGHERRVLSVAFSPDGARVVTGSDDGTARIWDIASSTALQRFNVSGGVRSVAYSPTGAQVAVGAADGNIQLWNVESGAREALLTGHVQEVFTVNYSPDGALLASGGRDTTARLWDVAAGAEVGVLRGHGGWVLDVAFSPLGVSVATGSGDGTARIWDLSSQAVG